VGSEIKVQYKKRGQSEENISYAQALPILPRIRFLSCIAQEPRRIGENTASCKD